MKTLKPSVFSFAIGIALISVTGFSSHAADISAAPTNEQVDKIIASMTKKAIDPAVRTELENFQKKGTMQEKRDFLSGAKSIDLPKPRNSAGQNGIQASSLPKCQPHYGCRFRSVCKYNKWTDVNSCEVVIDNCPEPTCD